jgi:hypothetical protein
MEWQEQPNRLGHRAGEVGHGGIDANHQIEILDQSGSFSEIGQMGREVDERHAGGRPQGLPGGRPHLKAVEFDVPVASQGSQLFQAYGTVVVVCVVGISRPGDANPRALAARPQPVTPNFYQLR